MFVIPIKNVCDAEAGMNGFLRGHRVLAVKKEFVPDVDVLRGIFGRHRCGGRLTQTSLPRAGRGRV